MHSAESREETDDGCIYIPVEGITFEDLPNLIPKESASPESGEGQAQGRCSGTKVSANQLNIALFRLNDEVFAVQEKCPHAGGPLHMGDIEMLPDKTICVRCPWHRWAFDLKTGERCLPSKGGKNATTYPVKVHQQTKRVYIGFDSIDPDYLKSENF